MEEIKNKFLRDTDTIDKKEDYNILFMNEKEFRNVKIDDFNEKLKEFIQLQKENEEIDLSYVCFHEHYDFSNTDIGFGKILTDLHILDIFERIVECGVNKNKNKKWLKINKSFNFGNAIFYKRVEFIRAVFEKQMSFEGATFESDVNFENSQFTFKNKADEIEVSFEGIICKKEVIFNCVEFFHKVSFFRARFNNYTSFKDAIFHDKVDFENTISKDLFFFHNVKLGKISFIGSHLENANFLRLKDKDKKVLQKDNFQNKDSVRLVKAQYEKENNTTEVNWSFPLEQEFYLDLLKKEKSYYPSNNINKISLLIHKYVSNYGTDWVRVLIIMFGFGFLASLGYSFFDIPETSKSIKFNKIDFIWLILGIFISIVFYIYHFIDDIVLKPFLYISFIFYIIVLYLSDTLQVVTNNIATLLNPFNIFKPNKEYFKDIVLYGLFIKVSISALFYQFVISFRNSSRRK